MYICNNCGHTMETLPWARIYGDNLLEGYMDERDESCPCCKRGDMIEAVECKVCGEYFDNSSLYGVCKDCLAEHQTVGDALKFGDSDKIDIPINNFIASVLDFEKINSILEKYVEEHFTDHCDEVKTYLKKYEWEFSEFVEKEKKND